MRFEITNISRSRLYETDRRFGVRQHGKKVQIGPYRLPNSATPWVRYLTLDEADVRFYLDQVISYMRSRHILIRTAFGDVKLDEASLQAMLAGESAPAAAEEDPAKEETGEEGNDDEGEESVSEEEEAVEESSDEPETEPAEEPEDLTEDAEDEGEVDDHTDDALEGDEDDPEDKTEEALPNEAVEGMDDLVQVDTSFLSGSIAKAQEVLYAEPRTNAWLQAVIEAEKAGKNRKTLVAELEALVA